MRPRVLKIDDKRAKRALTECGWNVAAAIQRLLDHEAYHESDREWQEQARADVALIVNAVAFEHRRAERDKRLKAIANRRRQNRRRAA